MKKAELKKYLETKGKTFSDCNFSVNSLDFGRDINGNGTANFICRVSFGTGKEWESLELCRSLRREQVGYGDLHEGAVHRLEKLGYNIQRIAEISEYSAFIVLES